MESFRLVSCTPDLLEIFGREHPAFYHAIRFEIEKRLPLINFSLYSYSTSDTIYWYGFKENSTVISEVYFCAQGPFVQFDFLAGFQLFNDTVKLVTSRKPYYLVGEESFIQSLKPFFESIGWDNEENKYFFFYVNGEQEKLLKSAKPADLPTGYVIGNTAFEDAEIMTSTWKYSEKNELAQTRVKISNLPTSCARFDGKPVGFEMVDPSGTLTHLYVLPEHRGKSLGPAIEMDLMKKCISEGFFVSKLVELDNVRVMEASDRSPFWTRAVHQDGSSVIRMYLTVWPEGQKPE